MKRHAATIENIDSELLFEQKCDLLDLIKFLESYCKNYPDYDDCKKKIASLDGVINTLNTISDQLERE